jgi:hypothetical protein
MMLTADWIAVGVVLVAAFIGLLLGFARTLKVFTGGIFGVIISIVVCYFLYGLVINWNFTQVLMTKIVEGLQNADNGFCNFLITIRIDIITVCVAMFIIIQLIRIILVAIVNGIADASHGIFGAINRIFGLVLMVAIVVMLALIVFQIISWVGGSTATDLAQKLDGSLFKLDIVFLNNPLNKMFNG